MQCGRVVAVGRFAGTPANKGIFIISAGVFEGISYGKACRHGMTAGMPPVVACSSAVVAGRAGRNLLCTLLGSGNDCSPRSATKPLPAGVARCHITLPDIPVLCRSNLNG